MRLFLICLSILTWDAAIASEADHAGVLGHDATMLRDTALTQQIAVREPSSSDAPPLVDRWSGHDGIRVGTGRQRALTAAVDLAAIALSLRLRMMGVAMPSEIPRKAVRDLLARLGQDFGHEPRWWRDR